MFRHSTTGDHKDKLVVYNCLFSPAILQTLRAVIIEDEVHQFIDSIVEKGSELISVTDDKGTITQLFSALYQEFSYVLSGSYSCLNSLLIQLMIEIYRYKIEAPAMMYKMGNHPAFIKMLDYLNKNYAEANFSYST